MLMPGPVAAGMTPTMCRRASSGTAPPMMLSTRVTAAGITVQIRRVVMMPLMALLTPLVVLRSTLFPAVSSFTFIDT
jgi:hypothetical protein